MVESHIESGMKGIPQIPNIKTLLIVVFDSFDSGKFLLVDPVHEFPGTLSFVSDLLNFGIKEDSLHGLDFTLEGFPIFQTSSCPVIV